MKQSVFFEMQFILLIVFSVVVPTAIYLFLYVRRAISRWAVLAFAVLLVVVSGIDVVLLQYLSEAAKTTESLIDDKIFVGELSLALYLVPAVFAGLGVNLLSHVLTGHLAQAEKQFDRKHHLSSRPHLPRAVRWLRATGISAGRSSDVPALLGGAMLAAAIFVLDLVTGSDIRLHVLYVFPLALVARFCAKASASVGALIVTTLLQIITFSTQARSIPSYLSDVGVALAASLLIIFLARMGRSAYLTAANQAATDALTNLASRRAFVSELEGEIARQRRYGTTFSLALLDLDGFRALNDSLGHAAGDKALTLAADVLRSSTRQGDLIGRIGGDEFAILMPNTRDVDCAAKLRALCATLATRMAAAGFGITASIGCKSFVEPPLDTSDALRQADDIMYRAKRGGKNQAVHS